MLHFGSRDSAAAEGHQPRISATNRRKGSTIRSDQFDVRRKVPRRPARPQSAQRS